MVQEPREASKPQELGVDPALKQILVIEDEDLVGQMLVGMLRHLGFQATLMADSQAAVTYYQGAWGEIDLVILDLVMPHLSGREVFQALRAVNPGVRVVLSSGYSVDGEAQKILEEGAVAFLQKPYQIGELTRLLGSVFAEKPTPSHQGSQDGTSLLG